jgi:hypothetical protein
MNHPGKLGSRKKELGRAGYFAVVWSNADQCDNEVVEAVK